MNESVKKFTGSVSSFWNTASTTKKMILVAIGVVAIVAIVVAARVSSGPTGAKVFDAPYRNTDDLDKAVALINNRGYKTFVSDDGVIRVESEEIAKKVRDQLSIEALTPGNTDEWESFYKRDWSATDKEQNIKQKNLLVKGLKKHIESLEGVRNADVILILPKKQVFASAQDKVSASITLNVDPSKTDLLTNKKKLKGLQRLILSGVQGLKEDDLVITDNEGNLLNDFQGMEAFDEITITQKQQKLRMDIEMKKKDSVLTALQKVMGEDRIADLSIDIDFDMSKISQESTEYSPIIKKADNPNTPYDDSEIIDTLPISEQKVDKTWQGTGYNPEGPAGVEGQTPPVYSDMSNVVGKSTETGITRNNAVNSTHTTKVLAPKPKKISMSFNVDGEWKIMRDPKNGKYLRKSIEEIDAEKPGDPGYGLLLKWRYIPVTDEELSQLTDLAKGAIGYDQLRGDTVNVTRIRADRSKAQQAQEDKYMQDEANKRTLLIVLVVVAVILVCFVLFRIVSKEMERRRRIREEELLRQQQAERERALWEARENTDNQVTMSVEDSRRAELQETAINLAKEHPEDVAMLIRTWLMEE